MHNMNEAKVDALGHTERASNQENLVPGNTLGALIVRDIKSGTEFKIGTGFDAVTRQEIWGQRAQLIGRIVSYQHFPIGVKDKPRFPSYRGFRDPIDM
jgi:DNA ligase-1